MKKTVSLRETGSQDSGREQGDAVRLCQPGLDPLAAVQCVQRGRGLIAKTEVAQRLNADILLKRTPILTSAFISPMRLALTEQDEVVPECGNTPERLWRGREHQFLLTAARRVCITRIEGRADGVIRREAQPG